MMWRTLYTSGSKKGIQAVVWFMVFVLLAGFFIRGLNYMYADTDDWAHVVWHGFYAQDAVDNLFLGSSHVDCSVNPYIIDERSGTCTFNLSSSAQRLEGSYYALLEANRVYDVKNVFVELYYACSTGSMGDYRDMDTIISSWRVTDAMKTVSPYKYAGAFQMNDSEHFLNALLPFTRYKKYFFDGDYIKKQIAEKKSADYLNYRYYEEDESGAGYSEYLEKGHCYTTVEYDNAEAFEAHRKPEEMHLTEDAKKYLLKIIQYCKKKHITLTFFISPMWPTQILSTENYDAYIDSVRQIADEHEVPFYDFNLCKEEYFDFVKTEYFCGEGHMNCVGAELYTNFIYEVFWGKYQGNRQVFYDTYREKMECTKPQLYGVYVKKAEEQNGRKICIAASDDPNLEFCVILTRTEEEEGKAYDTPSQRWVQDFDSNRVIDVPEDEVGICTVVWRMKDNPDDVSTMELRY